MIEKPVSLCSPINKAAALIDGCELTSLLSENNFILPDQMMTKNTLLVIA